MRDAAYYRAQAAKCRALAPHASDAQTGRNLLMLAKEYEAEARLLEARPPLTD